MNEEKTSENQKDASESPKTEERENSEKSEEQNLKSALAQKEHYREKFEGKEKQVGELETELEELRKSLPDGEKKKAMKVDSSNPVELHKTITALKDFTPEEVEEISTYARGKGTSLLEAAQSDFVKKAIEKGREEVEAENKVPGTTERGKSSSEEDFSSKSDDDIRKDWDNITRKAVEQGKAKKRKNLGI